MYGHTALHTRCMTSVSGRMGGAVCADTTHWVLVSVAASVVRAPTPRGRGCWWTVKGMKQDGGLMELLCENCRLTGLVVASPPVVTLAQAVCLRPPVLVCCSHPSHPRPLACMVLSGSAPSSGHVHRVMSVSCRAESL